MKNYQLHIVCSTVCVQTATATTTATAFSQTQTAHTRRKVVRHSVMTGYFTESQWSFYLIVNGRSVLMLITLIFNECSDMHSKHHTDIPYCDSHKICAIDKQLQQLPIASNLKCSLCLNCNCN